MHYTVKQAAEKLGISPFTVRRWLAQGTLAGGKFGPAVNSHIRIDAESVDKMLKTQAIERGKA